MTLKLFFSCYCCLFCYWKYGKATVQLSPIWHSNCSCLAIVVCFAIENTVKQPFTYLQYDTKTVLFLLLFCFAIENTIKQRSVFSNMTLKLFFSCYCCLFCYWKYGKATVQLSPIWLSNCSCLVIVVCFAIENTVKQPFSCPQYDTQTVLVLLLLFVLLLKIR